VEAISSEKLFLEYRFGVNFVDGGGYWIPVPGFYVFNGFTETAVW
jgi:hypothetical protein